MARYRKINPLLIPHKPSFSNTPYERIRVWTEKEVKTEKEVVSAS